MEHVRTKLAYKNYPRYPYVSCVIVHKPIKTTVALPSVRRLSAQWQPRSLNQESFQQAFKNLTRTRTQRAHRPDEQTADPRHSLTAATTMTATSAPAIFIDSHPDEQESYLTSWLSSIRTTFTIATTGIVERSQRIGDLRLKWYTHEGNIGFKDYPLQEYKKARSDYDAVLALTEVRRAMILGYPSQNPYITIDGTNPWVERFERERKLNAKMQRDQLVRREKAQRENFLDIDTLVEETERAELTRIMKEKMAEEIQIQDTIQKVQGGAREIRVDEEKGFLSRRPA